MGIFVYDYDKLRGAMAQLGIPDGQKLDDALMAHGKKKDSGLYLLREGEGNTPFNFLCHDLIALLEPTGKIPEDVDISAVVFDALWDARIDEEE